MACAVGVVKARENARNPLFGLAELQSFEHARDVGRRRPAADVDEKAPYRRRLRRGNLLDVHAALGREQDQRLARAYIVQDGSIEFAVDTALLLDQQTL